MHTWDGLNKQGFSTLPDVLWTHYKQVGLTSNERYVVLAIQRYHYGKGLPYPKVPTLCEALDWNETKVRRAIASLRKKELLITTNRNGRSLYYDFSPLLRKLKKALEGEPEGGEDKPRPGNIAQSDLANETGETRQICHTEEHIISTPTEEQESTRNGNVSEKKSKVSDKVPSLVHKTISAILSKSSVREVDTSPKAKPSFVKKPKNSKRRTRGTSKPPRPNKVKNFWYKEYKKKEVTEYKCHDIAFHFYEQWRLRWPNIPLGKFSDLDKKKASALIRTYKAPAVVETITRVIKNWEEYKSRYDLNGYPSMGLINGYRGSWISEVIEEQSKTANGTTKDQASQAIEELWG